MILLSRYETTKLKGQSNTSPAAGSQNLPVRDFRRETANNTLKMHTNHHLQLKW